MLIDQIKKDNIQAMKDRDQVKRAVYSVVITKYNNLVIDLRSKGKGPTDADLLNVIQKTLKELDDELEGWKKVPNRNDKIREIVAQQETIRGYLPKQLSEDDIKQVIAEQNLTALPEIMKYFKEHYAGRVDMSLVSQIARK